MDPVFVTAIQARRFRLLASEPKFLSADRRVRAEAVIDSAELSPFDALLVGGASESDRLCASAVRMLERGDDAARRTILELLAPLPSEHLLGVYHAIPRERQFPLRRALHELDEDRCMPSGTLDVEAAMKVLDTFGDDPLASLARWEAEEVQGFGDAMLARELGVDRPMSEVGEHAAEVTERAVARTFGDG